MMLCKVPLNSQRAALLEEARRWLGTPFQHQGRVRQVGCDCVGLLFGIAWAMGWEHRDTSAYGHRPDPQRMLRELREHLQLITLSEAMPGDVLLMAFEANPSHVALITDRGILHSAAMLRRVVEHSMDDVWRARVRCAYRFRELA